MWSRKEGEIPAVRWGIATRGHLNIAGAEGTAFPCRRPALGCLAMPTQARGAAGAGSRGEHAKGVREIVREWEFTSKTQRTQLFFQAFSEGAAGGAPPGPVSTDRLQPAWRPWGWAQRKGAASHLHPARCPWRAPGRQRPGPGRDPGSAPPVMPTRARVCALSFTPELGRDGSSLSSRRKRREWVRKALGRISNPILRAPQSLRSWVVDNHVRRMQNFHLGLESEPEHPAEHPRFSQGGSLGRRGGM